MARVKFYGNLKRLISEPIELEASTFSELMSGLLTQIKGLREQMQKGYYRVRIGKQTLTEEQIKTNPHLTLTDNSIVHFTPIIKGAGKSGGIIQAVLGVVLIVAGAYTGNYGLVQMGVMFLVGGAIALLTKPPSMNNNDDDVLKKESTSFSNIRNLTPQGRPVPLLYGRMMTSLVLISQGIETFDDTE